MLKRLQYFFKETGKTQTELAKMLDVTPQYMWKIENQKDGEPSERLILSTLKAFPDLDETWLRTGKGEMLNVNRYKAIAEIADDTLTNATDDFKQRFIDALSQADAEDLYLIYKEAKKIVSNIDKSLQK